MVSEPTSSGNHHQSNQPKWSAARWITLYVVLPCICGAIGVLPHVVGFSSSSGYHPFGYEDVSPIVRDETVTYAGVVRAALQGHWLSSAPTGPDRSETAWPSTQALGRLLPTALMVGLARIAGIANAFVIADFLFPALLALMVVVLSRDLGLSTPAIAAAAVFVLFGDFLINLPYELLKAPATTLSQTILSSGATRPLENSRTWIPQFSSIVLFATAWSIWRCVTDQRRVWIALSGALLAAASYTYAYLWPVLFTAVIIIAIFRFRDRAVFWRVILALLLGLVLSAPVIVAHLTAHSSPDVLRYGYGQSGLYLPNRKREILFALLIILLLPRRRPERLPLIAFLLAPWLCLFGAMAAGIHLQDWHWLSRNFLPWSMLGIVAAADGRLLHFARARKWAFALSALLLIGWAGNRQYQASLSEAPLMQLPVDTRHALEWMSQHVPGGAVVATGDTMARALIPVYSSSTVYLPFGPLSVLQTEELLRRYGHICALQGMTLAEAQQVSPDTYYWVVHLERGEDPLTLTQQDHEIIAGGWQEAMDSLSRSSRLPYPCDYLWLEGAATPPVVVDWEPAFETPSVTILQSPGVARPTAAGI